MAQSIPIYIPTYINSADYTPARILPRLLFFNGMLNCETYYIQDSNFASNQQNAFPYFDNYNVVSGSFPTTDSKSLLFNNEAPAYGSTPTNNLVLGLYNKLIYFSQYSEYKVSVGTSP